MIEDMLVMTATVYRRRPASIGEPDVDRFGQAYRTSRLRQPTRDEEPLATYPCRANKPSGGEQMQERSHDVVQDQTVVYFMPEADVREQDVLDVTAGGRTILEQAEITHVGLVFDGTNTLHHLEVKVSSQRPSTGLTREEATS
jgi:hypothetical protein